MALPFAILAMLSLTIFLSAGNLSLILLYTLLPVHMSTSTRNTRTGGSSSSSSQLQQRHAGAW